MNSSSQPAADNTPLLEPSTRLRWWLIALTLATLLCALLAVVFGLLINMDTKLEMNPRGDPLVRQDAIFFRTFTWGGVGLFILLLAAGIVGAWRAYARGRSRRSFGLSLLAAVPMVLFIAFFTLAGMLGSGR